MFGQGNFWESLFDDVPLVEIVNELIVFLNIYWKIIFYLTVPHFQMVYTLIIAAEFCTFCKLLLLEKIAPVIFALGCITCYNIFMVYTVKALGLN